VDFRINGHGVVRYVALCCVTEHGAASPVVE